jgi:uncharacterized membrane protein
LSILVYAFLIGVIAGLRALMAPTIVAWGAGLGWFSLAGSSLSFMASPITRYILSFLAFGELVNDKLPKTPSRKVPPQFIIRVITGAFSGAVLGAPAIHWSADSSPVRLVRSPAPSVAQR